MSGWLAFEASVEPHDGAGAPGAWWFAALPREVADEVTDRADLAGTSTAFGSVRVEAEVGRTAWATSLFPDARRGTYVLPVKAAVRRAEGLGDGAAARFRLRVVDPSPGGAP